MTNLAFPSIAANFDIDHIASEITLLAGQINAANHRLLKLIAQFDQRKAWSGGGTVRSRAHWLNWKCGIAMSAAREKVRVACCLESLPQIDAAFAAGEISYSRVRGMTRVATPENEDFLLRIAHHGTAGHIEQVVNKYRQVTRREDAAAELEQEAAHKLVYYQDEDGMWVIHARLPQEVGSMLAKVIEAIVAPIQAEKQSRECVSAETQQQSFEADEAYRFRELLEHSRADALIAITEHFLATGGGSCTGAHSALPRKAPPMAVAYSSSSRLPRAARWKQAWCHSFPAFPRKHRGPYYVPLHHTLMPIGQYPAGPGKAVITV